jgi:chemotaxis family two-component system response regulator Rcp1
MISNPTLNSQNINSISILLVEDSTADVHLIKEFLKEIDIDNVLHIARDGIEAMEFLHKNCRQSNYCPHVVILDLNLPKMNGHEVLREIKKDNDLKRIPVMILTTSDEEDDIKDCYNNYANCYVTKPVDFDEFAKVMDLIKDFWFNVIELPR